MTHEARASGKVILLGEHAVVYGAPALVAGLSKGAVARARRVDKGTTSELLLGDVEIKADAGSPDERGRAFAALLGEQLLEGLRVEAESALPAGGGLGSSAALGVAIARAVSGLVDEHAGEEQILGRAMAWEKVFHGNPSGIDTAAAMHGGCFRFSKSEGIRTLALPCDLWLAIGWSGMSSGTREMVEMVARRRTRSPAVVDKSIEGIRRVVENGVLALEAGDLLGFGKLMDMNQMLLAGLMLSTEEIESLCSMARAAGAFGAKLTGAGGGGSVIALVADEVSGARVVDAWKLGGFSGFVTSIRAHAEH